MPKPTKGPRLGSSPAHERKILANLAKSLIEHEAIVTTETKAKRLQPYIERLVAKAKKGDIHNRRQVARKIGTHVSKAERGFDAVYTLFDVVVPKFDSEREGGYTRIVKLPPRRGDNAPMAQISFVFDKLEKKAKVAKKAEDKPADKPAEAEEKVEEKADDAE
ncbi:MAG: 50S ribosomal protein L17 [Actinomycetaceae bacterium]|nr:50S ribosomal protein L17 [Actinomycetaceae bacterium]